MYKYLVLAFLSFFLYQDEPSIAWNETLELQWTNFKDKPQYGTTAIAVTASGILFQYSTKRSESELLDYKYDVKAHFYPEKSWYIREKVSKVTLDHERLHFDITELYARKLRQRITNTNFSNNINQVMDKLHETINEELRTTQNKYDDETSHSQIEVKQKEWQKFIAFELEKLSQYSQ